MKDNALVMIYFALELSLLATKSFFCCLTTLVLFIYLFFLSVFGNNWWTDKITSRMLFSKVFQDVGKMKLLRSHIVS